MEVSVWWVLVAALVGAWTGFGLCAVMTMARDEVAERLPDAVGMETHA